MSLRSTFGKVRSHCLMSMYRRPALLAGIGPVVSFTFDDFPRTALTVGAGIFESFDTRATYYVAMGLMNTENRLGPQFSHSDLLMLIERGHEVANHGFSHLSARKTHVDDFISDVKRCQAALEASVPGASSSNFAYPYGEASFASKRGLGPLMKSSRGTVGGFNGPEIDLNLLRANCLYGDKTAAKRTKDLINENAIRNSWLIFYSHDISDQPSPYGCTPALLQETLEFAIERGAKVLTVAEVLKGSSLG